MTSRGHVTQAHDVTPSPSSPSAPHIPVLLSEVATAMAPRDGGVYVDGTFGAGGNAQKLLAAAECTVLAIDRDPTAFVFAAPLKDQFGDRLVCLEGCFGNMGELVAAAGYQTVDGVMLDLGVSSMQLDQAERGFSFMRDGPLDMRMSRQGMSAQELLATAEADLLADILFVYGEERRARAIARAIVEKRASQALTRTGQLADLICGVLGQPRAKQAHPATRSFQALRIYLNDELGELVSGLQAAEQILQPQGRLAVVTFHSLEDRIVKQFFAPRTGRAGRPSRHQPDIVGPQASFSELDKRSSKARPEEVAANPRARSARLRAAQRTEAPAHPTSTDLMPARAPQAVSS